MEYYWGEVVDGVGVVVAVVDDVVVGCDYAIGAQSLAAKKKNRDSFAAVWILIER